MSKKGQIPLAATNSNFQRLTLTFEPKINRVAPCTAGNTCLKYHHCRSKDKRVIVRNVWKVQNSNLTLTFDILTPKLKRGPPWIMINSCVKYYHCMSKGTGVIVWKWFKSEFDLDLWPIDPKINRGPSWVMINSCLKYHHCMSTGNGVIMRKQCKLQSINLTLTFDLFTQKFIGVFLRSLAIHVWSTCIIIVGQKEME